MMFCGNYPQLTTMDKCKDSQRRLLAGRSCNFVILCKRGFSLVETIVATIVMTMLLVSVIAYVQYSGKIWQDGHSRISSINYTRMVVEQIRADLLQATKIETPSLLNQMNELKFKQGTEQYKIYCDIGNPGVLVREQTTPLVQKWRIARNVANFTATRLSTWTVQIHVEFHNGDDEEDEDYQIIASDTIVLMAPSAG